MIDRIVPTIIKLTKSRLTCTLSWVDNGVFYYWPFIIGNLPTLKIRNINFPHLYFFFEKSSQLNFSHFEIFSSWDFLFNLDVWIISFIFIIPITLGDVQHEEFYSLKCVFLQTYSFFVLTPSKEPKLDLCKETRWPLSLKQFTSKYFAIFSSIEYFRLDFFVLIQI